MAKTHATLLDEIQSELQDDGTDYTDTVLTIQLEKALREVSDYVPHIRKETFKLESRTGTATTDTGDALVDSSATFVDVVDIGKVIYNTTDNTWAVVTAWVSSTQLTLSKDIMVDGDESYKMFNKGCWNNKQINIEDVMDYIGSNHGVIAVEYKTQQSDRNYRNFKVEGDILTIDIDFEPPGSSTSGADIEVFVWFETRHSVVQFADIQGTVSGSVSAGAVTFTIAAIGSGTDVITEDSRFTVAGVRGTYTVQYELTLSSGGGTLRFWPGLESAPADGALVTFISGVSYGSTLDRRLERLVVDLTAARALISKGIDYIGEVNVGGINTWRNFQDAGERRLGIVLSELRRMTPPKTKRTYPKD